MITLILVLEIQPFAVAADDIAKSRVNRTICTCNDMLVWGVKMLDNGTYGLMIRKKHRPY